MRRTFKFTMRAIEALPPAAPRTREEHSDTDQPGLRIRVTETGSKTFLVCARPSGGREKTQTERRTIGRFPLVTVEEARKRAAEIVGKMKAGQSYTAARRAERGEMRFSELFASYIERHSKANKKTWSEDKDKYRLHIESALGKKRLSAIDRAAVAQVHTEVSKTAPIVANRVLALVSSVFSWAIKSGLWSGANPARGIQKNRETSRHRYVQPAEMARFFAAVGKLESTMARDFFLMCILTGARRSNVAAMCWADVDLVEKIWRVPATKNGEPIVIPLVPESVRILTARKAEAGPAVFVFPGRGKSGHYVEPKRAWTRVQELAKLNDLRIHDLRRSMGSWLVRTGASTAINAKALGHKSLQAASVYQRIADADPVREAMTRAAGAMLAAGMAKAPANVERLEDGRKRRRKSM